MGDSHRHLEITEEEWGAFMDDLQQTMKKSSTFRHPSKKS
jgi:hypothetical protein